MERLGWGALYGLGLIIISAGIVGFAYAIGVLLAVAITVVTHNLWLLPVGGLVLFFWWAGWVVAGTE